METVKHSLLKIQLNSRLLKYCLVILLTLGLTFSMPVHAEEEALVKSAFVFNFAKFTRWPEYTWDFDDSSFVVCTAGEDQVAKILKQLTGESVQNRIVQVLNFYKVSEDSNCNLIYVANDPDVDVNAILKSRCCESILTVSDVDGFASRGGMIEMYTDANNKIHFKINRDVVVLSGLNISSRLLSLAEIVEDAGKP